jgi:hypothetical protein
MIITLIYLITIADEIFLKYRWILNENIKNVKKTEVNFHIIYDTVNKLILTVIYKIINSII